MTEMDRHLAELSERAQRRERLAVDDEASPEPDPRIQAVLDEFLARVDPLSAERVLESRKSKVCKTKREGGRFFGQDVEYEVWEHEDVEVDRGWQILRGSIEDTTQRVLVVTADGRLIVGGRDYPKSSMIGMEKVLPQPAVRKPPRLRYCGPLKGRVLAWAICRSIGFKAEGGEHYEDRTPYSYTHGKTEGDATKTMPGTLARTCAEALAKYGELKADDVRPAREREQQIRDARTISDLPEYAGSEYIDDEVWWEAIFSIAQRISTPSPYKPCVVTVKSRNPAGASGTRDAKLKVVDATFTGSEMWEIRLPNDPDNNDAGRTSHLNLGLTDDKKIYILGGSAWPIQGWPPTKWEQYSEQYATRTVERLAVYSGDVVNHFYRNWSLNGDVRRMTVEPRSNALLIRILRTWGVA